MKHSSRSGPLLGTRLAAAIAYQGRARGQHGQNKRHERDIHETKIGPESFHIAPQVALHVAQLLAAVEKLGTESADRIRFSLARPRIAFGLRAADLKLGQLAFRFRDAALEFLLLGEESPLRSPPPR